MILPGWLAGGSPRLVRYRIEAWLEEARRHGWDDLSRLRELLERDPDRDDRETGRGGPRTAS